MADDPLAQHIQSLIGDARPGPSGVFSVDLSRVQATFRPDPQDWLHYWLRFAAFYGAESAELEWDGSHFLLRFASNGPDQEELRALLLHVRRGPRYLALGMLAAARQGFRDIRLEAPHGSLTLQGFEEDRRARDGFCRLSARHPQPISIPPLPGLVLTWFLNGKRQSLEDSPGGLRLVVDGFAFPWEAVPLLPPGEPLDWPVEEVRLDALLRRLIAPALSPEAIERLQLHFEARLLERAEWRPEAVEWLLLRARGERVLEILERLPAPPDGHALVPAYRERRQQFLGEPVPPGTWENWPSSSWPGLLQQGLAPFPLDPWLLGSCSGLPGRVIYAYLLRSQWRGAHFDPALLQALLQSRRDRLSGNVLLALQLRHLRPVQRPQPATDFCRLFLRAAVRGEEATSEWSSLTTEERQRVERLAEDL